MIALNKLIIFNLSAPEKIIYIHTNSVAQNADKTTAIYKTPQVKLMLVKLQVMQAI